MQRSLQNLLIWVFFAMSAYSRKVCFPLLQLRSEKSDITVYMNLQIWAISKFLFEYW